MTIDVTLSLPGCTQVMHRLFYFLDESKYEDLVALFLPEGTLFRQGVLLAGREQIMQAMSKRSATQRIRHVISNAFIEAQSRGMVHMVAYMVAYRFDDGALRKGPVEISRPFRMSLVRAAMREADGVWHIAEMSFTPEFEFASDAAPREVRP
jgi:hypothetical protein